MASNICASDGNSRCASAGDRAERLESLLRATKFQFRTTFSAELLPPLRQTACCTLAFFRECCPCQIHILSGCTFLSGRLLFYFIIWLYSSRLLSLMHKTAQLHNGIFLLYYFSFSKVRLKIPIYQRQFSFLIYVPNSNLNSS